MSRRRSHWLKRRVMHTTKGGLGVRGVGVAQVLGEVFERLSPRRLADPPLHHTPQRPCKERNTCEVRATLARVTIQTPLTGGRF